MVNFAAGGVATPADAALMMQLGVDGVFVGSGIFKSGDPSARARAIVQVGQDGTAGFAISGRVACASSALRHACWPPLHMWCIGAGPHTQPRAQTMRCCRP